MASKPGNASDEASTEPLQHNSGPRSCYLTANFLTSPLLLGFGKLGASVESKTWTEELTLLPSEAALLTHPWTCFDSASSDLRLCTKLWLTVSLIHNLGKPSSAQKRLQRRYRLLIQPIQPNVPLLFS